jgi:hypothetical protein
MPDPDLFYDIFPQSLNHAGEELCGDEVRILRTRDKSIVVLSDGLGSGVKANILARLTTSIIVTMLREHARIEDVIETVVGTLPICKVRQIAYSTFLIVEIEHSTGQFKVINCDSPDVFFLHEDAPVEVEQRQETILGKVLRFTEGRLAHGDFLAAASDGVIHAGVGMTLNFRWGRKEIGEHLKQARPSHAGSAEALVRGVMKQTTTLCGGEPGDDATFVGILARRPRRLMVFTGPPLDRGLDEKLVERLSAFAGRKIVCGGTTSAIVGEHLGEIVRPEADSGVSEVPPMASIDGIDLVTEGMLTMARTLQLLQNCRGHLRSLPFERNGAVLLARELLQADFIQFLVGQQVNPYYQNPLLPRNISIRRNLVEQIATLLQSYQRSVEIEWV